MDVRRAVGENVRQARIRAGLTQEELAERSGFSQQYLSGLERGKRNPTIISVYELSQALGISFQTLLKADCTQSG